MNKNRKNWEIIFVLPNLNLKKSYGNDKIAIVSNDDSRITDIVLSSVFAKSMVNGFEDQFKRKMHPAFLIIPGDSVTKYRELDTMVGFRNIFAISCIINGFESFKKSSYPFYTLFSDSFDFYPITINKTNDGYLTSSPSVSGYDSDVKKFCGQVSASLANPHHVTAEPDSFLYPILEKSWRRRYVNRRFGEWQTNVLFRSLEMAYQASTMPFRNHSTIYDKGSNISLWVSAFEILSHPQIGKANLKTVLDLLSQYPWIGKKIKRKSYKVNYRNQELKINIVQKLYKEMYDTRNDFLHGNPVKPSRLYPFKNKKLPPIAMFAPLIYKVALLSFLDNFKSKSQREWLSNSMVYEGKLSKAILKSKGN